MTRLMLVDDEIEIRQGIRDLINWKENNVEVCGEACNGREAIKTIDEINPQIILVDIKMPVMNGLELIEYLSENYPMIKTIIVSGYDDFNYAQKALKLGASDYLLKPCRPEEILSTVLKAAAGIEEQRLKQDKISRLKIQLRESLPLLKEKFLIRLIKEEHKYLGNIEERAEFFKLKIRLNEGKVILIGIDNYSLLVEEAGNEDAELYKFAVKNIAEEILGGHFNCEIFEVDDDIAAIINSDGQQADSAVKALAQLIKNSIKSYMNFTVTVGIGDSFFDEAGMNTSYRQAQECLNGRFFIGEDTIITYKDINVNSSNELTFPLEEEKKIITAVKTANSEDLELAYENFFKEISKTNHLKQVINSCTALLFSIYHLCIERNININEITNQETVFEEISKLETVHQLKERLSGIIKTVFDRLNKGKNSNKIVGMAIDFIRQNYNKDISLEVIAQELHFSAGYVGMLFKQTMGISFIDYLHKTRIEKACEILKDCRLKTYEVSNQVGYFDEKYFSQIFKKITGMTCTQYRDTL